GAPQPAPQPAGQRRPPPDRPAWLAPPPGRQQPAQPTTFQPASISWSISKPQTGATRPRRLSVRGLQFLRPAAAIPRCAAMAAQAIAAAAEPPRRTRHREAHLQPTTYVHPPSALAATASRLAGDRPQPDYLLPPGGTQCASRLRPAV